MPLPEALRGTKQHDQIKLARKQAFAINKLAGLANLK
jgi:hypothetical protein